MKRQSFIAVVCFVMLLLPFMAPTASGAPPTSVTDLVGENRLYYIDFLVFTHLGEGTLRLEATESPDIFRVEMVGRTVGIASWLTGDRVQTYTSTMQLMPDGSFKTIEHVANVQKKKHGKMKRYRMICQYDCENGTVMMEKIKDGVVTASVEKEIPEGMKPVDLLTAFYNLRLGVYGELARGNKIYVPTFSSDGFTEIEVKVLTTDEQKRRRDFPQDGLLLEAVVDPEFFDTKTGRLLVWLNEQGVPARGVIEDMIGLGDLVGYLVEEKQ